MPRLSIFLLAVFALSAVPSFAGEAPATPEDAITKSIEVLVSADARYMPDRKNAMSALAQNPEAAAGPMLNALEKNSDAQARLWLLLCINSFEDMSVFRSDSGKIVALLKDENFGTKYWAIKTVARMKLPSAMAPLAELLNGNDYLLRAAAATAVGVIGGPAAPVDKLIELLGDENMIVRSSAAESLGELKDAKAKKPLIAVLEKEDESLVVKRCAVIALEGITSSSFGIEPQDWTAGSNAIENDIKTWIAANR